MSAVKKEITVSEFETLKELGLGHMVEEQTKYIFIGERPKSKSIHRKSKRHKTKNVSAFEFPRGTKLEFCALDNTTEHFVADSLIGRAAAIMRSRISQTIFISKDELVGLIARYGQMSNNQAYSTINPLLARGMLKRQPKL